MPFSKWLRRLNPFHGTNREDQTWKPTAPATEKASSEATPCPPADVFDESEAVFGDGGPIGEDSESPELKQRAGENKTWSNEEWLGALRDCDPQMIKALRDRLARGLLAALERASLRRKVPYRTKALAREAAREALEKILGDLDAFQKREESISEGDVDQRQFTTWAQKIAVHTAFTKVRQEGPPLKKP